jgi:3',5'-nucleoside bisphosphate phosphatase
MSILNADLHSHSNVSDGTLPPEAVAERAAAAGVEIWALTDHDEIGGVARARTAAHAAGMGFLSGTEISVTFADTTVHIVGLGFDETHPELVKGLHSMRYGREARAREMGEELAKVGIKNAYEGALKYVGNPDLISRTHFARYIVEIGQATDTHDVFRRYLGDGKPGFVPHRWATLADAVGWINRAGGAAVIAHPGRYKFTPNEEWALFHEFKALGGRGVEVVTGSHHASEYDKYAGYAGEFGLAASRGSDFHSPEESHTPLGGLPWLPGQLTPIWEAVSDRVQWPQADRVQPPLVA